MMSQIVMTSNRPKSALPYAFTEQGVAMLSGLLKSDVAIGELSSRIEEKKQAPRRKIGFQQNMED